MALNVNLFVHGVPMGQKIWGPNGDDQRYLSSFYGPEWEVPEVMKIDIMTFGKTTYCYYTLVKGQNVCDAKGRAGSYFALTLRMNAYYADIQNLYHLLHAVCEKFMVGLCIRESNGTYSFMHQDFNINDSQLKDVEAHMVNYISEFSVSEDIIPLAGFSQSRQETLSRLNLHECTKSVALSVIKRIGKLAVSPWFLDSKSAATIATYKQSMEAALQHAQQEILMNQQSADQKIKELNRVANEKIANISQKANDDMHQCKESAQQKIEAIRQEAEAKEVKLRSQYANAVEQIKNYKQKNNENEKTISDIEKELCKKDEEIDELSGKLNNQVHPHISFFRNIKIKKKYLIRLICAFVLVVVGIGACFLYKTLKK